MPDQHRRNPRRPPASYRSRASDHTRLLGAYAPNAIWRPPKTVGSSRLATFGAVGFLLAISIIRVITNEPLALWFAVVVGLVAILFVERNAAAYRQDLKSLVANNVSGVDSIGGMMTHVVALESTLVILWSLWLGIDFGFLELWVGAIIGLLFALAAWRSFSVLKLARTMRQQQPKS